MARRDSFFVRSRWKLTLVALGLAGLASMAGCMAPPINDPSRIGPFFKPTNFTREAMLPANLRRVVLLPVSGPDVISPETAFSLDEVFAAELQKKNRFEVVTLSRAECRRRFGLESFGSATALPHNFLAALQREFAADAVMFVDVTSYSAYHPLLLGVRAKFVTIDGSHVFWTFDTVFSASDPAVANSARSHFIDSGRGGVPADFSPAVLQSPARFASYVAAASFETLPPVYSVPSLPKKAAGR